MSPLKLSYAERRSLRTLIKHDGTCFQEQIKASHAERFLRAGLISRSPMRFHLTTRGQVEFLRQRYFGLRTRAEAAVRKNEDIYLFFQSNSS